MGNEADIIRRTPGSKQKLEHLIRTLRGALSPAVDAGIGSLFRDTVDIPHRVMDLLSGEVSGDQKILPRTEAAIERDWNGPSKPKEFGKFDIYMASGWKPEGPIKINGEMVDDPKPVDNILAVYVRNVDGSVEILDPSWKMNGYGDVGSMISALWDDPKNEPDRKWQETAGAFLKVQLAPLLLSGGLFAAEKMPGMGKAAEKIGKVTDAIEKSTGAAGIAANFGDMAEVGKGLASGILTKGELDKLAGALTGILTGKDLPTDKKMREILNNALEEHSYKEGAYTNQTYIPSLREGDDAWGRFETLMKGRVSGFEKPSNPWQDWQKNDILPLGDVREAMRENPRFQKAALGIYEKVLTGQALSAQEELVMRIGISSVDTVSFIKILSDNNKKDMGIGSFTPDGQQNSRSELKHVLSDELGKKIMREEGADKHYGVTAPDKDSLYSSTVYPDEVLLKYVQERKAEISQGLDKSAIRRAVVDTSFGWS